MVMTTGTVSAVSMRAVSVRRRRRVAFVVFGRHRGVVHVEVVIARLSVVGTIERGLAVRGVRMIAVLWRTVVAMVRVIRARRIVALSREVRVLTMLGRERQVVVVVRRDWTVTIAERRALTILRRRRRSMVRGRRRRWRSVMARRAEWRRWRRERSRVVTREAWGFVVTTISTMRLSFT